MSLKDDFAAQGLDAGNHFALAMRAKGTSQAAIEVKLYPGETFYAERGLMRGKDSSIKMTTRIADKGGFLERIIDGVIDRWIAKEDVLIAEFENNSSKVTSVEVTPETYSGLYAVNLADVKDGTFYCRPGAWVMSGPDNKASFEFFRNLLRPVCWFKKLPYLMEEIKGDDIVVIGSSNSPLREIQVAADEIRTVDSKDLYAYTKMDFGLCQTSTKLASVGNLLARFIPPLKFLSNREDILNIQFHGPGTIVLHTPPQPR